MFRFLNTNIYIQKIYTHVRLLCIYFLLISFGVSTIPQAAYAHVSINSAPTTSCGSLDSTDFVTHVGNQVDNRISSLASSTSMDLFSVQGDTTNPLTGATTTQWVRNTNVWTNQITSIDWTGVSPWNQPYDGYSSRIQKAGTLISPRHVLLANHWYMPSGSTLAFITNDNQTVYRTLVDSKQVGTTDLRIGILDSDVPDSITYYPVMATSTLNSLLTAYKGEPITDLPVVVMGQDKKVGLRNLIYYLGSANFASYGSTNAKRQEFNQNIQSGDSGHPGFVIVDNQPVLLFHLQTTASGPSTGYDLASVNSVMQELGGGYQLTEYTPNCFDTYTINTKPAISFTSGSQRVYNPVVSTSTVVVSFTGTEQDQGQSLSFSIDSILGNATSVPMVASDFFSISTTSTSISLRQKQSIDPTLYGTILTITARVSDGVSGHEGVATTSRQVQVSQFESTTNYIEARMLGDVFKPNSGSVSNVWNTTDGGFLYGGGFTTVNNGVTSYGPIKLDSDGNFDPSFPTTNNIGISLSTTTPDFPAPYVLVKDAYGDYLVAVRRAVSPNRILSYNGNAITNPQQIIKIKSDGTIDTTFQQNLGTGFNTNTLIYDVKTDENGDIFLWTNFTGSFNGTSVSRFIKLKRDGTLDTTFHSNYASTTFGGGIISNGYLAYDQSSKSIYVGAGFSNYTVPGGTVYTSNRLAKINQNGTMDTQFSSNLGTVSFVGGTPNIAVRPDGKLVVFGQISTVNSVSVPFIALLNSNGVLDSDFKQNIGTGFSSNPASSSGFNTIGIQSDNKIIIGGTANLFNGSTLGGIIRLNADGTLDTDFESAKGLGLATTELSTVRVLEDGSVAISCACTSFNGSSTSWGGLIHLKTKTPSAPLIQTVNNIEVATSTILNTHSVLFQGQASTTAEVQMYIGGDLVATTTADSIGDWSFAFTMPEGTSEVTFTQSLDILNTATSTTAAVTVLVDSIDPAPPVITSHSTGSSIKISDTISGSCEAATTISASGEGLTSVATSTCSSGAYTLPVEWSSGFAFTTQSLYVVSTDTAGNTSTTTTSLRIIGTPSRPTNLTLTSSTQTLRPAVSVGCETGATVSLYSSSTLLGTGICSASSASITSTVTLELGTYLLYVVQTNIVETSAPSVLLQITLVSESQQAEVVVSRSGGGGGGGSIVSMIAPTVSNINKPVITPTDSNLSKSVVFQRNLGLGQRGEDVRNLQKFLNQQGFTVAIKGGGSKGNETLYFGPATKNALIKFQRKYGIRPTTGQLGPLTRAQIKRILSK